MPSTKLRLMDPTEFRGRVPVSPGAQLAIVQTADDAFQLELLSPEPAILADPADVTRPYVFSTIEACARFASREFGAHRVRLDLRD